MNMRDLSEKLEELAVRLDNGHDRDEIAKELRALSNQTYAPGNGQSWADIAPKSTKKTFTDKQGRVTPF